MKLEDLPEIILEHIFDYLSTRDRCRLLGSSRRLWKDIKDDYEQRVQTLTISDPQDAPLLMDFGFLARPWPQRMYHNFGHSLHTLNLSSYCTDRFLRSLAKQRWFPHLKHISMPRSHHVTNEGLAWLSQHTPAVEGEGIETIDITFCSRTTYAGTFGLRDRLRTSLECLRRQPTWLDGKFHTPFAENDTEEVEVHTYYPDGSFSFNRENQSRGFVSELMEWDQDYLADKLQYSNFAPLVGWPTWTTYSYRPGVCLLRLPDQLDPNTGEPIRTVLVGQSLRGLRPPKIKEVMKQNASMPIGTSAYYTKDPDNGRLEPTPTRPPSGGIMISKMRVYPLESLLPPDDLVAECRTACEVMRDLGEDVVDSGENYLNEALSQVS